MAKNTLRTQQNKAVVRPECKNRTSTPRPKPKHQRPHSLLNILCSVFKERTTGSPSGDVRAAGRPPVVCAAWHTSPGRWRCRAAGLEHRPELALLAPNCSGLPTADGQDTDPRPRCQQLGASRRAHEAGSAPPLAPARRRGGARRSRGSRPIAWPRRAPGAVARGLPLLRPRGPRRAA
jgi:hypothetical protein